jgi:hypothetical protein
MLGGLVLLVTVWLDILTPNIFTIIVTKAGAIARVHTLLPIHAKKKSHLAPS